MSYPADMHTWEKEERLVEEPFLMRTSLSIFHFTTNLELILFQANSYPFTYF